jgi:hypothetical protein
MRNLKTIALIVLPLLAGCFAQLETNDVTLSHSLCGTGPDCVPGGGASLTLIQVSGSNTFAVDFGNQPLLQPSSSLGPATLNTTLLLNGVAFDITTTGTGADFSGVQTVQLLVAPRASTGPGDDPCATQGTCSLIASFDRATDGAGTRHLALKTSGIDLINFIAQASHSLILEIKATGNAPQPTFWNADVSMDISLTSRANFP